MIAAPVLFISYIHIIIHSRQITKKQPIVRDPIKQAYLVHEASINALRTIGYFLRAVVVIDDRP